MLIGFYISNLGNFRQEAIDFIVANCYGYDKERATNIVDREVRTYIYSDALTSGLLSAQPFTCVGVNTTDDVTLVSLVDHKLELPFINLAGNLEIKKLAPTEYFIVTRHQYYQFKKWVDKKILRSFSNFQLEPDLNISDFDPADFATQDIL
jgi:hypothetical protein